MADHDSRESALADHDHVESWFEPHVHEWVHSTVTEDEGGVISPGSVAHIHPPGVKLAAQVKLGMHLEIPEDISAVDMLLVLGEIHRAEVDLAQGIDWTQDSLAETDSRPQAAWLPVYVLGVAQGYAMKAMTDLVEDWLERHGVPVVPLRPVDSSNISSCGWRADEVGSDYVGTLLVCFHDDRLYAYRSVPAEVASKLVTADSVGAYFAREVRGVYDFERLT